MANRQAFEAGWNDASNILAQRHAHKQARQDEAFEDRHNELLTTISNLQAKLPTLLKTDPKTNEVIKTPEYDQTMAELTQAIQAKNQLFDPAKNPGVLQKFGHLLRGNRPAPAMTTQPQGIQQPAMTGEPIEIGAQPGSSGFELGSPAGAASPIDPKLATVAQSFPRLAPYLSNVQVQQGTKPAGTDRGLEFYPPWESTNPNPGKITLELYDKMEGPALTNALGGDLLHYLGGVDPKTKKPIDPQYWQMKQAVLKARTPQQDAMDRREYENAKKTEGETRSYEDWLQQSRVDAYIRGYVTPEIGGKYPDDWRKTGQYNNPGMLKAVEQIRQYVTTPPPKVQRTQRPGLEAETIPGRQMPAGRMLPFGRPVKVQGPAQNAGQARAWSMANQKAQTEANMLAAAVPASATEQAVQAARAGSAGDLAAIQGKMQNYDTLYPDATPEERQAYQDELMQATHTGNYKTQNLILADGTEITAQQDAKTGRWYDLYNRPIPPELLKTAKVAPKPGANKGLEFDMKTGQVKDTATGKRYDKGDPNNSPEVKKMFASRDSMIAATQAFQEKLAAMRAAGYGQARQMAPMNVLDTWNGNAPEYMPYTEMRKNPGRYLPAGEADKALAKENLMQDIMGTSQLTRSAINNLQEDFPEDMKAKIALAMRADDPHSALDMLISSGSLGALSSDQQDFLIATRQLAENAMAMRTILGAGQGSEDMRNAIRDTLPGLLTPDRSFALRQLDAFDKTIARLHRGVPKVPLRTDIENGGGAGGAGGGGKPKHSLSKAMKLPFNKGKTEAQVRADLEAHNYEVIP